MDQTTDSLHMSLAQIIAEVKGLATHVTGLLESEAKHSKKINQILNHIEGIKAHMNVLEGAGGAGIGAHARGSSGGSRSVSNKHPLLKVCNITVLVSPVSSVLKTLACGAYDVLSDVRSGGVREQREMYQQFVWGGTAGSWCAV